MEWGLAQKDWKYVNALPEINKMKKKHHLHHVWLILGIYGIWFAIFSGLEEVVRGKAWKVLLSLLFGTIVYLFIEFKMRE